METNNQFEFIPSTPVHPFDIVEDEIAARGLTKKEFAESIGMKPSNFSRMIRNKGELTSDMALKLEAGLSIPYRYWMRFQEQYIKDCITLKGDLSDEYIGKELSDAPTDTAHEDIESKISSAFHLIKERMESINLLLSMRNIGKSVNLSEAQITTIENDFHRLGRALCELRLS